MIRFLLCLILSCSPPAAGENPPIDEVKTQVSKVKTFAKAPDFTLRTPKGALVRLSDYKGKVILLNFWATWCAPCIHEMPHLQKLYEEMESEGFIVFGVNVDEARHASGIRPLVKKLGVKFPILLDKNRDVMKLYNPAMALPYNVIIKKDGTIYAYFEGYSPGQENEMKKVIHEALDYGN